MLGLVKTWPERFTSSRYGFESSRGDYAEASALLEQCSGLSMLTLLFSSGNADPQAETAFTGRVADVADTLPIPSRWRRSRHRQAWIAVPFILLAIAGLIAAIGGVLPGLVLLLMSGPLGLLCILNARVGGRRGHSVRLVTRGGATQLEFPSHRLGTALVLLLVSASLSTLLVLLLLYSWEAFHGSLAAGVAAIFLALVTGYGVYGLWVGRTPRPHRGWPAVRLGAHGVELIGPIDGWFMPWDVQPVPVPLSHGVLRLVPLQALHELSQPLPEARLLRLRALPGSIAPAVIDADLAVVAATVFFYGREPEHRAELTSPAGVQRVHQGDLPKPWPDDI
jgi:hypothetical protein